MDESSGIGCVRARLRVAEAHAESTGRATVDRGDLRALLQHDIETERKLNELRKRDITSDGCVRLNHGRSLRDQIGGISNG